MKIQERKLRAAVKRAYQVPFIRRKMQEQGVAPDDIRGLEDLSKLPFTTKEDLLKGGLFDALAVPRSGVVRVHTSSGTTNRPVVTFYTRNDLETWSELLARNLAAIGAKPGDVFLNTAGQGMFTGGLGYIAGAERLGLTVVPMGPASPERQLEVMKIFGVTVFHAIPSFALRIADAAERLGIDVERELSLRLGILGAEPWTEEMRRLIEERLGIKAYNNYGAAELGGPGVAVECIAQQGMHVWEDHFIVEVVDPKTGEQLEPEENGELVITPLWREAMPLLRYRTRDVACILDERKCECGREMAKISWIHGRLDDMIKVRGIGLYPSAIEKVILRHPEVNGEYLVTLEGYDDVKVKVEVKEQVLNTGRAEELAEQLSRELKATTMLKMKVELLPPGTLPRREGKARRVLDLRGVHGGG